MFEIVLNFIMCMGVAWVSLCRLNVMTHVTCQRVRLQFVLLLAGAVADGLQPVLWGSAPGAGSVALAAAIFVFLLLSRKRWLSGAPPDVSTL